MSLKRKSINHVPEQKKCIHAKIVKNVNYSQFKLTAYLYRGLSEGIVLHIVIFIDLFFAM